MSMDACSLLLLAGATIVLVIVGTLWPVQSAIAMAGAGPDLLRLPRLRKRQSRIWQMKSAGKIGVQPTIVSPIKSEFTESEFVRDLTGSYASLAQLRDPRQLRRAASACLLRRCAVRLTCAGRPWWELFWRHAT